jgi:hypothetical protein
MNNEFDEYIHDEAAPADWRVPIIWSAFLLIGFIVFEITARPQWGLAFVCLKFGWNYFRSAFWLLRVDPNRQRSWACFWLYLGAGLFKASVIALLAMFALTLVEVLCLPANPLGQQALFQKALFEMFLLLLTAFLGFGLSAVSTLVAIGLAKRHGIRFWLDGRIESARRSKAWPPYHSSLAHSRLVSKNWASTLIFTAFVTIAYLFLVSTLIMVFLAHRNHPPVWEVVVIACFVSFVMVMYGGLLILCVFRVQRISFPRLVASSPWECWSSSNFDLAQT